MLVLKRIPGLIRSLLKAFIAVLLFIPLTANAFPPGEVLILDHKDLFYGNIQQKCEIFIDSSSKLELTDIIRLDSGSHVFKKFEKPGPYFKRQYTYWIKLTIENRHSGKENWALQTGTGRDLAYVDVFQKDEAGAYNIHKTGQFRTFKEKELRYGLHNFAAIHLPVNRVVTLYIKAIAADREGYFWIAELVPQQQWTADIFKRNLFQGIAYGVLSIFFLVNLILFIQIKDKSYLYYCGEVFFNGLYFIGNSGFMHETFLAESPEVWQYIWPLFNCTGMFCYILFIAEFMKLKSKYPKISTFVKYYVLANIVIYSAIYLYRFYDFNSSIIIQAWFVKLFIDTFLSAIFIAITRKDKNPLNRYIFASLIIFIIGFYTEIYLVFVMNQTQDYGFEIVILLDCLMFALALVHRVNTTHQERISMQEAYIEQLKLNHNIQQRVNEDLEMKVTERTQEINFQQEFLKEKNRYLEVLLAEIHHRVKNNLQIISSLLNLQKRRLNEPAAILAINDSQNRVQAMSLLHQHLYQFSDRHGVNFEKYIRELVKTLDQIYSGLNKKVSYSIKGDLLLNIEMALPVGLIINELVTNSLKYAFENEGTIEIQLIRNAESYTLTVKDSGKNLNQLNIDELKSLGLKLVRSLIQQLNATLSLDTSDTTTYHILIPISKIFSKKEIKI